MHLCTQPFRKCQPWHIMAHRIQSHRAMLRIMGCIHSYPLTYDLKHEMGISEKHSLFELLLMIIFTHPIPGMG